MSDSDICGLANITGTVQSQVIIDISKVTTKPTNTRGTTHTNSDRECEQVS